MYAEYVGVPEWYRLRLQPGRKVPVVEFLVRDQVVDQFLEQVEDRGIAMQEWLIKHGERKLADSFLGTLLKEGRWGFGAEITEAEPSEGFTVFRLEIPYVRQGVGYSQKPERMALNVALVLGALSKMAPVAQVLCEGKEQLMVVDAFWPFFPGQAFTVWVSKRAASQFGVSWERKFSVAAYMMGQAFNRMWPRKSADPLEGEAESKNGYLHLISPHFQGSLWCEEWRDGVAPILEQGYVLYDSLDEIPQRQLSLLVGLASVWGTISGELE